MFPLALPDLQNAAAAPQQGDASSESTTAPAVQQDSQIAPFVPANRPPWPAQDSSIYGDVRLLEEDPEVKLTQMLTQANVEDQQKKRYIDSQSFPAIQQDYLANAKHLDFLEQKISDTQDMLSGKPPARQAPQMNLGENIASLVGILLSHNNPFATGPMLQAGMENAAKRGDMSYANALAAYEAKRQVAAAHLHDLVSMHQAATQHGYDLQNLGLQTRARLDEIAAQGQNQRDLYSQKLTGKAADAKVKVLAAAMRGASSAQKAAILQSENYSPEAVAAFEQATAQEEKARAEAGYIQGAKTENTQANTDYTRGPKTELTNAQAMTETAKQIHMAEMDSHIESEIKREGIMDGLTKAQIAEVKGKTALLDPEFQVRAARAHAIILRVGGQWQVTPGAQPPQQLVAPLATYARLLNAQLHQLDKSRDPFSEAFKDPDTALRYTAIANEYNGILSHIGRLVQTGAQAPAAEDPNAPFSPFQGAIAGIPGAGAVIGGSSAPNLPQTPAGGQAKGPVAHKTKKGHVWYSGGG